MVYENSKLFLSRYCCLLAINSCGVCIRLTSKPLHPFPSCRLCGSSFLWSLLIVLSADTCVVITSILVLVDSFTNHLFNLLQDDTLKRAVELYRGKCWKKIGSFLRSFFFPRQLLLLLQLLSCSLLLLYHAP